MNKKSATIIISLFLNFSFFVVSGNMSYGVEEVVRFSTPFHFKLSKIIYPQSYRELFQEEVKNSSEHILEIMQTKFKQVLWRAGDLAALDDRGNFIPVIHQYTSFNHWMSDFVRANPEIDLANSSYDFVKTLERKVQDYFTVENVEDFMSQLAQALINNILTASHSIREDMADKDRDEFSNVSYLTRRQISDREAIISHQDGRAENFTRLQKKWNREEWVNYSFYKLNNKINFIADEIIDYFHQAFEDHIVNKERGMSEKVAYLTAGTLGFFLHPVVGWTILTTQGFKTNIVPTGFFNCQKNSIKVDLQKAKSEGFPLIEITEEQIVKYYPIITSVKEIGVQEEQENGEEWKFTLIDQKSIDINL